MPEALLAQISLAQKPFTYQQIEGGRNNQAYLVTCAGQKFFCKKYFTNPGDIRDRQGHEWHFLRYCHTNGIDSVPTPLAYSRESGMSLFSWCDGRRGAATDASDTHIVAHICGFLSALRDAWAQNPDSTMPPASDACLDMGAHLALAQRKLTTVYQNIVRQEDTPLLRDAKHFLETMLLPHLESTLATVAKECPESAGVAALPLDEQFPSPSDFGLHNALVTENRLVFVDFEYAGRDSPVKLLCDAVCQPDNPLPEDILPILAQSVVGKTGKPEALVRDIAYVLSLHRLKWCGILLNEFDRLALQRRMFATNEDMEQTQARQLAKCRNYFERYCAKRG